MTAIEWFWNNINDIRATLTSCIKCDGEGEHVCDDCKNMTAAFCPNCLIDIADGQGNCPRCHALASYGCESCNNTGHVKCQQCEGKGYQIGGYELDGKSAATIDALYRKFNMPLVQNRVGEVVRFHPANFGYKVVIDRNHAPALPFGTLKVSDTGWAFEHNGKAHAGKVEDVFLDNASNAIHELYCEVTQWSK